MKHGLIGMPLGHSHSPFVHSFFGYDYGLMPTSKEDLADFFGKKDFDGISVTIPHKTASIPFLDELDESVSECGAVNTVINRNGKLTGYNTDIDGMSYTLTSAGIDLRGKKVLVLGSGGTSHTACALCRREKASSVTVVSRTGEVNYDNVYALSDAEIILNTTPVGMSPNNGKTLLDLDRFPALSGVFDAIYNPVKTRLVLDAEKRNIPCAGGIKMLVAQAEKSAEIFTGLHFGKDIIPHIVKKLLEKIGNITLIGMPGSGKTTVGKALASITGKQFFDIDQEIEKSEKMSIPEIFASRGESYFRERERYFCAELGKKQGVVLSSGGGAVLDEENVFSFRQNGVVVRLTRPLETLPTEGRPLSVSTARLAEMATEREPFYASSSDLTVANDAPVEVVAEKIAHLSSDFVSLMKL